MRNFAGKYAFITGGASGGGLGQAKVFSKAGMKVAIADVRQDALDSAVKEIMAFSGAKESDVLALKVDLTNREEYTAAADRFESVFGGPPHLLIQTAGVNSFGPAEASTFDDYDWVVGVCLDAVVNGLVIFVPRMIKAYGFKEEFHVAATSSMGAFGGFAGVAPYSAAKAAVNSLIYSYDAALKPYGAGATVLCPGNINSNIGNAEKFRPEQLRNTGYHISEGTIAHLNSMHAQGIDPVELGTILKEGIENGRILVLPFTDVLAWQPYLQRYGEQILDFALTAEEREQKFAEAAKNAPPRTGFTVPEGAERFGMARENLEWVDPNRRPQKK
ncbi:MAG: SDR family NAD(P)-dependent oxidoreductase [Clostridiales bacterium]|nr:SDR family NAD(P)-dependent oxidoreductase [Clostridiales bacterium]